jgi:hypothetical protein
MGIDTVHAYQGYQLLTIMYAEDGSPREFFKTPVVAWRILSGGNAYPVGDAHNFIDAVMRPDGSVYITGDSFGECKQFGDEAEALQHFIDDYRRLTNSGT